MVHAVDAIVADLADRLWRAESERVAVPPLTADLPDLTVEDAYAIQTINIDRRIARGAVRDRPEGRADLAADAGAARRATSPTSAC